MVVELIKGEADLFAAEHDICSALETVDDGLPAGVEVVVLCLDDAVVDVHGGNEQLVGLAELVEAVHARHALLHHALHRVKI